MSLDRAEFFDGIRHGPFPGTLTQPQVEGTAAILDAMGSAQAGATWPLSFPAYMLATAFHETAHTMQPIEEYGHGRGRAYGRPSGPYGQTYFGRGLVQLTWLGNYVHATERLRELGVIGEDIDLAKNPELALRPDIAAAIMIHGMIEGWFSGKKLANYLRPDGTFDFVGARHIINGTDRAQLIAGYAHQFLEDLQAAGA